MTNSIVVISSCLFGSVYLMTKSLELINNHPFEDSKTKHGIIILNGLTFIVSGSIFVSSMIYTFKYFNHL